MCKLPAVIRDPSTSFRDFCFCRSIYRKKETEAVFRGLFPTQCRRPLSAPDSKEDGNSKSHQAACREQTLHVAKKTGILNYSLDSKLPWPAAVASATQHWCWSPE